ncbi:FISUMP domain-containing protein [Chryseobacterium nematophagum]|nr:FISUMP domain-containing protein [Chryseobacterium nematophagum]
MKKITLFFYMILAVLSYGQVGINTPSPKATLDVIPKNTDGSTAEGVIVPRFTGNQLFEAIATGVYTMDQHGAIVYIYTPADEVKRTGQTIHIDDFGFYYFDGYQNTWNKMGGVATIYRTDGSLTGPRLVTMAGNNLGFIGGRIGMGTSSPEPSAILDLTSTNLGFLTPRMTKVQMNAITYPAQGLEIYCTDCFGGNMGCKMINDSADPLVPNWGSLCSSNVSTGVIIDLQCGSAITSGVIHEGVAVSGVTVTIPYTGGNGGTYPSLAFNSTGVTGLTLRLDADHLASGNGNLVFTVSGTASAIGTASFDITIAGASCTLTIPVVDFTAVVSSLECNSAVFSPTVITQGSSYMGTLTVPYLGGNGESYSQQSFTQNGLTFTLPAGTLATGNGNLVYNITGIATVSGAMTIPIEFGTATCNVNATVASGNSVTMCMGSGTNRVWASHNLGADTSFDPNVPVKEIHGNYYQWGRNVVVADTDTPPGAISGWNTTYAPDGAWNTGTEAVPAKNTTNDPCPSGFRLPTSTEWSMLNNNSSVTRIGSFTSSNTNFTSALVYSCGASKLTLPTAGFRDFVDGTLYRRGDRGNYWSSTGPASLPGARSLFFFASGINTTSYDARTMGYSVRCISE